MKNNNSFTSFIILILCCLCISPVLGFPGDSLKTNSVKDTSQYFAEYSELLALRIYSNTKWNTLDIIRNEQKLILKPNVRTSLGLGFNYKSYGLALAVGIPNGSESNRRYGQTKRFDVQANVYGEKVGFDGFFQIYRGYYNSNPQEFVDWDSDEFPKIPDMRVLSAGVNAFRIFNSDKFSYKSAFVRNQVQLKSAGSFTLGIFGHLDLADSENGLKPKEIPDSLLTEFDLKSFNTLAIGITIGYLYTWVISDHFFINVGVTPGFGNQRIELATITGEKAINNSPAAQLTARSAIGYESPTLYGGITGVVVWRNFQFGGYELDLSTENFKVFIGKRFKISKKRK